MPLSYKVYLTLGSEPRPSRKYLLVIIHLFIIHWRNNLDWEQDQYNSQARLVLRNLHGAETRDSIPLKTGADC